MAKRNTFNFATVKFATGIKLWILLLCCLQAPLTSHSVFAAKAGGEFLGVRGQVAKKVHQHYTRRWSVFVQEFGNNITMKNGSTLTEVHAKIAAKRRPQRRIALSEGPAYKTLLRGVLRKGQVTLEERQSKLIDRIGSQALRLETRPDHWLKLLNPKEHWRCIDLQQIAADVGAMNLSLPQRRELKRLALAHQTERLRVFESTLGLNKLLDALALP